MKGKKGVKKGKIKTGLETIKIDPSVARLVRENKDVTGVSMRSFIERAIMKELGLK
jgi:hypothetical protein